MKSQIVTYSQVAVLTMKDSLNEVRMLSSISVIQNLDNLCHSVRTMSLIMIWLYFETVQ